MSQPEPKRRPAPVRRRKSESAPRPALEHSLSTASSKPASPKEAWTKPASPKHESKTASPKPASKNGTKKLRPAPVRHRTINSVTTNGSHSASHSGTRKKKKPPRRASVNNVNKETTERKKIREKIKREAESRLAELKRETEIIKQKIQERKALQEKANREMLNDELDRMSYFAQSTAEKPRTLKNRKEENKERKISEAIKKSEEMHDLYKLQKMGTSMNQGLSATDNKELEKEISSMIAKQYKPKSEKTKSMEDNNESEHVRMYHALIKGRPDKLGQFLSKSR